MKRLALLIVVMTALAGLSRSTLTPAEATFPGFNGKVVFTTDVDGNEELYSINPDGSSLTRLTNDPATDRYPAVSSDGTRIAFTSNRDGDHEIYVMNADGTGLTQLTDNTAFETQPVWSPDGSEIAFHTTRDGNNEVYVMNSDGTGQQNVTNSPSHEFDADWSPDGGTIAFGSTRNGDQEIFLMDPDGADQRFLVDGNFASWSPDGSRITFEVPGHDGSDVEVGVVNADGTGQEIVTDNSAHDFGPVWSPDGRFLLLDRLEDGIDTLWILDPTSRNETSLPSPGIFNGHADWSPLIAVAGDANCDDVVNAVDALQDLRYVAALGQPAECVAAGNVKCDDGLTATDALFILRYVAQLPVNLPQGCPEIGA
jgi:Tol biopolymer transport system component